MSQVRHEVTYKQNFYYKSQLCFHPTGTYITKRYLPLGVNLSPQEHAQQKIDGLRAAFVELARLDPNVRSVQYGTREEVGVGSDWAVVFTEKDYDLAVVFDVARTNRWTHVHTRKAGYAVSVTVVEHCTPTTRHPADTPRHLMPALI